MKSHVDGSLNSTPSTHWCVTLNKLLDLDETQLLHLKNMVNKTYHLTLL